MPKRIQRKRTRGWRMPDGVVYVGRPSRWGNPYTGESAISNFRTELEWYLSGEGVAQEKTAEVKAGLEALRGRTLACWCRTDRPCHADVLLELANQ